MRKKVALVFCGEDEISARGIADKIRKNEEWGAQVVSAFVFNGKEIDAERTIIMPDVPGWHGDRIAAAYPNCERKLSNPQDEGAILPLYIRHRGRGRFYVMRGIEAISGPHSKDEATRIVSAA